MRIISTIIVIILSLSGCNTKLIVTNQNIEQEQLPDKIYVIPNDSSRFIPASIYPNHKVVDNYVAKSITALYPIDSLLCATFEARNIKCSITGKDEAIPLDAPQIVYKDYWTWDFSDYMHILKIKVYKSNGTELMEVVSQGNTSGMHNYPQPKKQVPKMVDLIINKGFKE